MRIEIILKRSSPAPSRGGGRTFYVETMTVITYDGGEFIFRGIMDIIPDSNLEALGIMDKMFEMGKFSILKKFIEAKEMY